MYLGSLPFQQEALNHHTPIAIQFVSLRTIHKFSFITVFLFFLSYSGNFKYVSPLSEFLLVQLFLKWEIRYIFRKQGKNFSLFFLKWKRLLRKDYLKGVAEKKLAQG